MKRWALRLGVPESVIVVEEHSRTTYENALHTKAMLGSARILLVTAAYHMPRAVGLFEKQGFTVTPVTCGYESKHRPLRSLETRDRLRFHSDGQSPAAHYAGDRRGRRNHRLLDCGGSGNPNLCHHAKRRSRRLGLAFKILNKRRIGQLANMGFGGTRWSEIRLQPHLVIT